MRKLMVMISVGTVSVSRPVKQAQTPHLAPSDQLRPISINTV